MLKKIEDLVTQKNWDEVVKNILWCKIETAQDACKLGVLVNKTIPHLTAEQKDRVLVFMKNLCFNLEKKRKPGDPKVPTVNYEKQVVVVPDMLGVPDEFGTKNLLLVIDMQRDFVESSGPLYVPGGEDAAGNLCKFLDINRARIDDVVLTMDDHYPGHIGNAAAWKDKSGRQPDSFTAISSAQVEKGLFVPKYTPVDVALKYLRNIESKGAAHKLWPLHCIHGDRGQTFPDELMLSLGWWSEVHEGKQWITIAKGSRTDAEMYSVFSYADGSDPDYTRRALDWLAGLGHDKIFIAGVAKDICVAESVKDLVSDPRFKDKLVFVDDAMAAISTKDPRLKVYDEAVKTFGAKIV